MGSTWGQPGVNLGSTWGHGVDLGSTLGQPRVNRHRPTMSEWNAISIPVLPMLTVPACSGTS